MQCVCPPCFQTVTEKHKLNVPETMTEVLDVSDEEGMCSVKESLRTLYCFNERHLVPPHVQESLFIQSSITKYTGTVFSKCLLTRYD